MQTTPGGTPAHPVHQASPEPAVEVHGRVMTTNQQAAACYREAQCAVDWHNAIVALRLAVAADAAFAVAVADLAAVTEALSAPPDSQQMSWERHHVEVVRTASTGDVNRALDLLREHLAERGLRPPRLPYRRSPHLPHGQQRRPRRHRRPPSRLPRHPMAVLALSAIAHPLVPHTPCTAFVHRY